MEGLGSKSLRDPKSILENLCICYFSDPELLFVAKNNEIQDLFWKTCVFATF